MPIVGLKVRSGGSAALVLHSELHEVERRRVGETSGWRYLQAGDCPPDLANGHNVHLLPVLQ